MYHNHDCNKCHYLGSYDYTEDPRNRRELGQTDLYCCGDGGEIGRFTVIARYGEGGDYSSGLIFAHPSRNFALHDAKELAIERGIIKREVVDPWIEKMNK